MLGVARFRMTGIPIIMLVCVVKDGDLETKNHYSELEAAFSSILYVGETFFVRHNRDLYQHLIVRWSMLKSGMNAPQRGVCLQLT